jgi:hypothetical protein
VTQLLQCLRDELVRRDYAATTIRSYVQIVDAFRQHTGPADLRAAVLLPIRSAPS